MHMDKKGSMLNHLAQQLVNRLILGRYGLVALGMRLEMGQLSEGLIVYGKQVFHRDGFLVDQFLYFVEAVLNVV